MTNIRISRGLANIIGRELVGSHKTLEALFVSAGASGPPPPNLSHADKWKTWIFQTGEDQTINSLSFLGDILEEFMDVEPSSTEAEKHDDWLRAKQQILSALEANGLEYYQGGRVIPNGNQQEALRPDLSIEKEFKVYPNSIDELIKTLVRGLPRAIYPLQNRRKNSTSINFTNEYDVQDFLHAMLRPWISDVRAEEYVPSYAGSNTRMDFLIPKHSTVIETKIVRDSSHAKKIGQELTLDIAHYAAHPDCKKLWCVIYDPENLIANSGGVISDLQGESTNSKGTVSVVVEII